MKISNDRKLGDLQEEFNNHFPFLRIEFFNKPHEVGVASEDSEILDSDLIIGELRHLPTSGFIPLDGNQKVGDFEQLFAKAFGLNVQVYRKSHGKWLQTWATDIWTIEEQNNRGRIMGNKIA
jgi:hypothetical protein